MTDADVLSAADYYDERGTAENQAKLANVVAESLRLKALVAPVRFFGTCTKPRRA